MRLFVIFLAFAMTCTLMAHNEHSNPKAELERVSQVIETAFIEIDHNDALAGDRPFRFIDYSGNRFYLPRLRLTQALIIAIMQLERSEQCRNPHSVHHCHHREGWRDRLMKAIAGTKFGVGRIAGSSAEIAHQYGIVPLAVVLATWLPYTMVTEIMESFVVGPAHLWCTLSQMLYFGAIKKLSLGGKILSDAVMNQDLELTFWQKLRTLVTDSAKLAKYRKALCRVLLDSTKTISNRVDFWKYSVQPNERNAVTELYALSGIWMDYHANHFDLSREMNQVEDDSKRLLSETEWRPVLAEMNSSLELLASLVRQKIGLAFNQGEIDWKKQVYLSYQLGGWTAKLEAFERSIILKVRAKTLNQTSIQTQMANLIAELRKISTLQFGCEEELVVDLSEAPARQQAS